MTARGAQGFAPGRELRWDIEQSPARVAEGERERAFGEDLDLLRGRQDYTNVAAGACRLGVAHVIARAGMGERLPPLSFLGPAMNVDRPGHLAVSIDEKKRANAIAKAMY